VPVQVDLLDPLGKMTKPSVALWVGEPGKPRGPSKTEPPLLPGDGQLQSVVLAYDGKGRARGEVVLPPLPPGKVYWYRPSYVNGAGQRAWVAATTFRPTPAVDREPAALVLRHEDAQRSIDLESKASFRLIVPGAKDRTLMVNMNTRLGEQTQAAAPQGLATVNLNYQSYKLGINVDGKAPPSSPRLQQIVKNIRFLGARLVVDGQGNIKSNQVNTKRVPAFARADLLDLHGQISDSLEAVFLPLPNRTVQPGEKWSSVRKLPIQIGSGVERAVLSLTMRYEGTLLLNGRKAALLDLSGYVKGGEGRERRIGGRASGRAAFDLERGQFSITNLTVLVEMDIAIDGERVKATGTLDTRLSRSFTPPVDLAAAREILNTSGELTAKDPTDRVRAQSYHKAHQLVLEAGRTYVIDMKARAPGFDPYLRLEDDTGKEVASDDDGGGGLDARIVYTAARGGPHRIVCTTYKPQMAGPYQLTVKEAAAATSKPPDPPVVKLPEEKAPQPGKGVLAGAVRVVGGLQVTELTLPGKGLARCLCWAPDGKAFYTLHQDPGVLRRVRYPDFTEEQTLEIGAAATWLAPSADGLVLSVTGRQEVWLIDPVTLKVTKRLPLPGLYRAVSAPPLSVAVAAVGDARRVESLVVLDLKTGGADKVYGLRDFRSSPFLGFQMPTMSPDGTYLFTVGAFGHLHRFRLQAGMLQLEASSERIGQNPSSIAVSPDSRLVCLPSGGGNSTNVKGHPKVPAYSTYIYAVKTLDTPVLTITQGPYPRAVAFDAKTGKIYSQSGDKQLLVFSAQGARERELVLAGRGENTWQILAHPEGGRVLVLTDQKLYSVPLGP
jgi:hypothetical protein